MKHGTEHDTYKTVVVDVLGATQLDAALLGGPARPCTPDTCPPLAARRWLRVDSLGVGEGGARALGVDNRGL